MIEPDKHWQHGLCNICIGLTLISGLQGCEYLAKFARSPTGKAVLCGGGATATAAATYFGCNYLGEHQAKGKTKADIDKLRVSCVILAAGAALADGFFCWLKLSEKIVEDYDQTKEALGYDASQGFVVKILEFNATPKIVRPGNEVKIRVKYALMSPNPTDEIRYERKITLPGENKPRTQIVTHQPGTWGTDGDYSFTIDKTAPEGRVEMTLEIKLSDFTKHDRRTLCFNVTRQDQPDNAQLCPLDGKNNDNESKVFVVSKVKRFANVCIKPGDRCKNSKSKNFLDVAPFNGRFPVIDEVRHGSIRWYKIRLQDGREGWLRESTGTLVEQ